MNKSQVHFDSLPVLLLVKWGVLVCLLLDYFAKEVFSTTKIGEKQVSVVSIAMQKLLQADLPKQAKILLVGAGQTNQLGA